jgi:hypothetical protein
MHRRVFQPDSVIFALIRGLSDRGFALIAGLSDGSLRRSDFRQSLINGCSDVKCK